MININYNINYNIYKVQHLNKNIIVFFMLNMFVIYDFKKNP